LNVYLADENVAVPVLVVNKENPAWPKLVVLTGVPKVPVAERVVGSGGPAHALPPLGAESIHTSGRNPPPVREIFEPLARKAKASTKLLSDPVALALLSVTVFPMSVGFPLIVLTVKSSSADKFVLAPEEVMGPLIPDKIKPGASESLLSGVNRTMSPKPETEAKVKVNDLSPISQLLRLTMLRSDPLEQGSARANFGVNNRRPSTRQHPRAIIEDHLNIFSINCLPPFLVVTPLRTMKHPMLTIPTPTHLASFSITCAN